jgi:hypothetical protein
MKTFLPRLLTCSTLAASLVTFCALASAATNIFTPSAANPPPTYPYCLEAYAYVDGASPDGSSLLVTGYAAGTVFQGSVQNGNCEGPSAPEGLIYISVWVEYLTASGWTKVLNAPGGGPGYYRLAVQSTMLESTIPFGPVAYEPIYEGGTVYSDPVYAKLEAN